MADKNMLANRNQLHSQFISTGSPADDIATRAQGQAQAGKEKEDREEEGKPRFRQRSMPDEACFGRLLENQKPYRQSHPHAGGDESFWVRSMQKVASANTESKATIEKLISESGADALLLQYRQLPELPEDAVGRLHQGTVINTSVYLDMLTKSQ